MGRRKQRKKEKQPPPSSDPVMDSLYGRSTVVTSTAITRPTNSSPSRPLSDSPSSSLSAPSNSALTPSPTRELFPDDATAAWEASNFVFDRYGVWKSSQFATIPSWIDALIVSPADGVHSRSGTITFPISLPPCDPQPAPAFVRLPAAMLAGQAFAPRSVRGGGAEDFDGSAARLIPPPAESGASLAWHIEQTMCNVVVIMCHGGYFAVAHFVDGELREHKTMRKYVTRRKQGGRQSNRDRSGRVMFSAGSHLRRTNEEKLARNIKELLAGQAWASALAAAQRILLCAPGPANREIFFGVAAERDREPPLFELNDPRIRGIPIKTNRPATAECVRVFELMTAVHILTRATDREPGPETSRPTLRTIVATPGLLVQPPTHPRSPHPVAESPTSTGSAALTASDSDLSSASGESSLDDAIYAEELARERNP
ncbi:uncharacterized protein AMSG_02725 [Thecamonas trahens ATCC 50062]|uniref:VLRF1 domain-containing protein n=1 Tax=Thecamonas trahens ATCC 50062 TaxID=461836 RepID=A0A0L0D1X3_THETB|nr:hypothetical protein AMSG_02725 [Thecamonas trahens ATCC 50062]KNC46272.1 hypothetical protein AMSG_02725 [Thecamonas trahens ATCC 50062]|eukprot:XP_013760566.1 hypothetical protein AMSG_02725 [Thecamonas trahens ATCC 50062]